MVFTAPSLFSLQFSEQKRSAIFVLKFLILSRGRKPSRVLCSQNQSNLIWRDFLSKFLMVYSHEFCPKVRFNHESSSMVCCPRNGQVFCAKKSQIERFSFHLPAYKAEAKIDRAAREAELLYLVKHHLHVFSNYYYYYCLFS